MGLRAVGKHSPDLALAVTGGFEDDVAAVGSPTGALVLAAVASDLTDLAGGGIHDVDVEIAIRAAPTEGDHLAVGGPRRVDQITFVGKSKFAGVGAVGVHEVELGNTSAIADEYDALAGLGVPGWRRAGGVGKGDALGAAAVGVDDEEFGIAEHGGGKHDLRAVGGPRWRAVGAAEAREGDDLVGVHGVHADLRADYLGGAGFETSEGDAGCVRRPARRQGNCVHGRERMLIGAVVVHYPEFFCASARADEGDLRGGDAGKAAGEAADDFVGELVGEFANLRVGGRAAVDLADDGLIGGAADVVEPGGDDDFGGGFGEITEGDEVGVDLRGGPIGIVQLGGLGGNLGGVEAGADEIHDAAELQVVPDDLGEELRMWLGGILVRSEIGYCQARFVYAEAGAGTRSEEHTSELQSHLNLVCRL